MRDQNPGRIYRLLPGHVRARDHGEGRPLEALMRILAAELEVLEGDIDTLYENWFIETCEDWAVPYIGDLVGARLLRPFGEGGGSLRAYVANTLSYRQAKGTVAVIEQLARDVTGWPAHAVELFRHLAQSQNVNHLRPGNLATLSLRAADDAARTSRPFETAAHSVGVRPVETGEGRYNIPNIGVFLWRLESHHMALLFEQQAGGYVGGVVPHRAAIGMAFRHFDVLGRDIPLFNRARSEPALQHLAREVDLPGPLRRRPVFQDLEDLRAGVAGSGAYFEPQPVVALRLDSFAVPTTSLHCCNLQDQDDGVGGTVWRQPTQPGEILFDPVLGRLSLHDDDSGKTLEASFAYGAPHRIGGGPYDRRASLEHWWDLIASGIADQPVWQIGVTRRSQEHAGFGDPDGPVVGTLAEAIDLWNGVAAADLRGAIVMMDSASYSEDLSVRPIAIPEGARLAIVAADWPAVSIGGGARARAPGSLVPQDRRPHVASNLHITGTAAPEAEDLGALVIDGLLLEGTIRIEDGNLGRTEVRHSTIGAAAGALDPGLVVTAGNRRLSVLMDHSISGPVDLGGATRLDICDAIVGEDRDANSDPAVQERVVDAADADLAIARSSLLGSCRGRTLSADATIFQGALDIARRQQGCVRFCYLPEGSRTPRRYRCVPDLQIALLTEQLGRRPTTSEIRDLRVRLRPLFTASVLGNPAFGQLARACPKEISEGAEDGGEIGAMNLLGNPARLANLKDALSEYLPFGRAAGPFFIT